MGEKNSRELRIEIAEMVGVLKKRSIEGDIEAWVALNAVGNMMERIFQTIAKDGNKLKNKIDVFQNKTSYDHRK